MPASLAELQRARDRALARSGSPPITSPADAERFLAQVGVALRYGPGKGLPIASLFQATREKSKDGPRLNAAALTNHLLEKAVGIEVTVVAGRLAVVHRSMMPALYALVRRGRAIDDLDGLSMNARVARRLLQREHEVTAGEVRTELGRKFDGRHDPAYEALTELQHHLLVDRGPYELREKGIHYLSEQGYPYHLFHEAHADLVRAAAKLDALEAADAFVRGYLDGAVFCAVRTLKSLFKMFLVKEEIDQTLARLEAARRVAVRKIESQTVAVSSKS